MVIMGETAVVSPIPIFQHMLAKAVYHNFLHSTVSQISHYYRQRHILFLHSWARASWINVNNCPTRCDFVQFLFPANCSTCIGWHLHPSSGARVNCNYSIRHWPNRMLPSAVVEESGIFCAISKHLREMITASSYPSVRPSDSMEKRNPIQRIFFRFLVPNCHKNLSTRSHIGYNLTKTTKSSKI
jgi:hypothetical protein